MQAFEIHDAHSVKEAADMLTQLGESASLYAGGTELLLVMKARLLHYDHLINIKTLQGLDEIRVDPDTRKLHIGALATHRALERSQVVADHLPLLAEVERQIANVRVRTVGTIGGNLCFAEPHSDPATLFMALGAKLELDNGTDTRCLSVAEFLVDAYENALEEGELLKGITMPLPDAHTQGAYQRFQFRERPALSVAVLLKLEQQAITQARIAVGCVNPTPYRAVEAEDTLTGKGVDDAVALLPEVGRHAAAMADPIDDLNGSSDYKKHLVAVLVQRACRQALAA